MFSLSIEFAIIDLTNPAAREWTKDIIKNNMVEEGMGWGWMHDFAEYTPFDAVAFDGTDPFLNHNDYPKQWAQVCQEALEESNASHASQVVHFMRSGSTHSPAYTGLYWMGDQNPTFSKYDGMQSAMIGLLNGGMSGFTLGHSDIGAYTSINQLKGLVHLYRTKELLLRWIEMNTFSDMVLRTHIGIDPKEMYQIWDDDATAKFFSHFINVHLKLKDYKMALMKEAHEDGVPPVRSLLMEFPEDKEGKKLSDQFMLGPDILAAPIFKKGGDKRDVYLPKGHWVHMFTHKVYDFEQEGGWLKNEDSPIGSPLVFLKGDLLE